MIQDYMRIALTNLRERRTRSWLTMIGIFIGIAAVVAIISLGQGLQTAVDEQFEALGVDTIIITPGGSAFAVGSSVVLDSRDRQVVENTPGVRDTMGMSFQAASVGFQDETDQALVVGFTAEDQELLMSFMGNYVEDGRMLVRDDNYRAVVGYRHTIDNGIWERGARIGDRVRVNDEEFVIVGLQENLGNEMDDESIFITEQAFDRVFSTRMEDSYGYIVARAQEGQIAGDVAEDIRSELRNFRGREEGNEDFAIQTTEDLMGAFNNILLIINVVIIGIAAISLVVGGVGIMNTMYTAVVERTQEIGVMKSVGARNRDVLLLFLLESGILGLLGGLVGVIVGLSISFSVSLLGEFVIDSPYLKFWWSWELILLALLFSFLAGAIAGLAPAYQASKKHPVDSLRYE